MYLLSVPSVSSRYFNKIKRTSYLGKLPALSLEILYIQHGIIVVLRLWHNFADNYVFDTLMSIDGGWHLARYACPNQLVVCILPGWAFCHHK